MLRFESVFWATQNKEQLAQKLAALGFKVQPSVRDPHSLAIYFGPETIEIFSKNEELTSLSDRSGLEGFMDHGEGIYGIGLESDNIADDYRRMMKKGQLEKPRRAKDAKDNIPLWTGFSIPSALTPLVRAWVVMNSPTALQAQAKDMCPHTHANTCFGLESIQLVSGNPEEDCAKWGELVERQSAGLQWNEMAKTSGRRLQSGERFFDVLKNVPSSPIAQAAGGRNGVFMLTLKVTDLEMAKAKCEAAGMKTTRCTSRDGFVVPSEYTGGPALRFVRAYWKRYLPVINATYPFGRRTDQFRPLGGAYSTTLEEGFADNWKY